MKQLSKLQKWLLIGASVLTVLVTFILFLSYKNLGLESKNRVIQTTENEVLSELERLKNQLQADFASAQKVADEYAELVSRTPQKAANIAASFPALFGVYNFSAIGIHPSVNYSQEFLKYDTQYALKTQEKLWAPFYKKEFSSPIPFPYDYTKSKGKSWYTESILEGSWTAPYLGSANNALVISYRSPIIRDILKDKNNGVVCLDYALGYIQEKVASLNLYRKGYGIIINEDSIIVSHPSSEYLGKKITEAISKNTFEKITALPEKKFFPIYEYNDRIIDRDLYFKYTFEVAKAAKPITYKAFIILKESETLAAFNTGTNPTQRVKSLRLEILCGLTLILSLIVFWVFVLCNIQRVWLLISLQSVTFILGTLVTIYVQLKTPLYSFSNTDTEITNRTELDAYLNAFKRERTDENPIPIETGFLIQNAKFSTANDLLITGFIWQKIDEKHRASAPLKDEALASLLEPDFPEAESLSLEILSEENGLIQWAFTAEIRQSFDYSNYPFDEEDIWLRIRPKKAYQDQFLFIPDFDSYSSFASQNDYYLNPDLSENTLKNGLEKDLFIKGWDIERTSFSIRDQEYATSFGKFKLNENYTHPELYFNISVKRRFLEVFVVYFIPILVTAFLLFTVLMTYTRNAETNELYGFNVSTVLGFCASLFFVIIVSHMSLRETLQTGNIIYLEYFFFCLYFLIAVVSIGAFFFSSKSAPVFFKKNNGQLIKMMYWPVFCFIVFILTALHFTVT